jgi:hypothetical protein
MPFPAHLLPEPGQGNRSLRFLAADGRGHFYDWRSSAPADRDSTFRDSVAIRYRGNADAPATDTLGWAYRTVRRTPSPFLKFFALPYGLADAWAVAANGDVIVVRAEEYRVDRISRDGVVKRGRPIPYERRPVTEEDRRAYIAELRAGAREANFPDPGPVLERAEWAREKPPFEGDVRFSADRVWVPLTRARASDPVVYDVVDFEGEMRERFAMPPETRVISLGPGFLLTARAEGSRVYLARWKWPPNGLK